MKIKMTDLSIEPAPPGLEGWVSIRDRLEKERAETARRIDELEASKTFLLALVEELKAERAQLKSTLLRYMAGDATTARPLITPDVPR